MKRTVEIEPVCPFIGKKCISDGLTREVLWSGGMAHPCVFWDGDTTYNGVNLEEPCRIKRAVNRILADEVPDCVAGKPDVPWDEEED